MSELRVQRVDLEAAATLASSPLASAFLLPAAPSPGRRLVQVERRVDGASSLARVEQQLDGHLVRRQAGPSPASN